MFLPGLEVAGHYQEQLLQTLFVGLSKPHNMFSSRNWRTLAPLPLYDPPVKTHAILGGGAGNIISAAPLAQQLQ